MKSNKVLNSLSLSDSSHASLNYPGLTALRGIAAAWVLLLHVYTSALSPSSVPMPMGWLFEMGWMGVDIFFTLSAFLLSLPYADALRRQAALPAMGDFFKRRALRILPAYYLQLLILGLLFVTSIATEVFWYAPTWQDGLAHILLWLNAWPTSPALVSTWWTLPVEFGFYLLLPLLAKCLTDKRWYWLLVLIGLSLLYRHSVVSAGLDKEHTIYWADHLPGRLFQFLIGMLAAFFWLKWQSSFKTIAPSARSTALLVTSLALIALPLLGGKDFSYGSTFNAGDFFQSYFHLFASIIITLILIAIVSGQTYFDRLLNAWPLQWLGKISYGLYLWHYPVMLVLRKNMGGHAAAQADFMTYFFLSVIISITLAFLSWHWLEAPLLRRFSKHQKL